MKVYLLYSSYDDGSSYDSLSWKHLCKIVDSEEKAKKWIFEQAVKQCKELANESKAWFDSEIHDFFREEVSCYLNQLDKLKFGDDRYVIEAPYCYEKYGFTYEIKEVE